MSAAAVRMNTLMLKFTFACNDAATAAGMTTDEWSANVLAPILYQGLNDLPNKNDLPAIVEYFRKSVGEETWAGISNNPSLIEMAKEHVRNVLDKNMDNAIEQVTKLLAGENISADEVQEFLALTEAFAN